jgi:hypothetical protein
MAVIRTELERKGEPGCTLSELQRLAPPTEEWRGKIARLTYATREDSSPASSTGPISNTRGSASLETPIYVLRLSTEPDSPIVATSKRRNCRAPASDLMGLTALARRHFDDRFRLPRDASTTRTLRHEALPERRQTSRLSNRRVRRKAVLSGKVPAKIGTAL